MRVAVMGSGGLGGYFGALLARGGADVSFIARGGHLEAMQRGGLRIEGGPDPFRLEHVHATDDPNEVGSVDLVMVCVKLWDAEAALRQLRPLVGPETALVSFQNGVLKDSYLRAAYDDSHVIGGVAYIATTVSQPGVITRTGPLQRLIVGEFDGRSSARVEAFHSACVAGGINAEVSSDIPREIWEKFRIPDRAVRDHRHDARTDRTDPREPPVPSFPAGRHARNGRRRARARSAATG